MKNKTSETTSQLKTWLWTKPLMFAVFFLGLGFIVSLLYTAFQTIFNLETLTPMYLLGVATFVFSIWYLIKKLPHNEMYQKDFIAITNGATTIAILSTVIALSIIPTGPSAQAKLAMMYITHSGAYLAIIALLFLFVSMYLLGVAISGLYAKYKRCKSMGVSPWKIILSMPFALFMLWTPGYLIKDKTNKSNLQIKCKWYENFTNWTISNFNNTLLVFLTLLFFKSLITGPATAILSLVLLIIYTLWYVKHKSDFVKNINRGYALTAVGINIAIILTIVYSLFELGSHPY